MNFIYVFLLSSLFTTLFASPAEEHVGVRKELRIIQAKELMGNRYGQSVVFSLESQEHVERKIYEMITQHLPKKYKNLGHKIGRAIIHESNRHGLDPYFVMAVISGESSFNPEAVGPVGEIGLMQIRLSTGKWMAELTGKPWKGKQTLKDPIKNIALGTAYIAWLRDKFAGHGQLYVAAYNMGATSVKKALSKKIWPKDYPRHVMKRYMAFYEEN